MLAFIKKSIKNIYQLTIIFNLITAFLSHLILQNMDLIPILKINRSKLSKIYLKSINFFQLIRTLKVLCGNNFVIKSSKKWKNKRIS
jgi:hypothetical protein